MASRCDIIWMCLGFCSGEHRVFALDGTGCWKLDAELAVYCPHEIFRRPRHVAIPPLPYPAVAVRRCASTRWQPRAAPQPNLHSPPARMESSIPDPGHLFGIEYGFECPSLAMSQGPIQGQQGHGNAVSSSQASMSAPRCNRPSSRL